MRLLYNGREFFGPTDGYVFSHRYNNIEVSVTSETFALCVNSYCTTVAPMCGGHLLEHARDKLKGQSGRSKNK